jgi:PEP-CTERM motif-containing protein
MKHSARIATISALLAIACAVPANAAKGIRTDSGNNWDLCGGSNTCVSLPPGLLVDALGDPLDLSLPGADYTTGPEGGTDTVSFSVQSDNGWSNHAPARSLGWSNDAIANNNPGDRLYAQILFFDLANAIDPNDDPEDAVPPDVESVFAPDGTLLGLNTPAAGAWEIAFTYNFDNFPDGLNPEDVFASLTWGGFIYTASYATLNTPAAASFVFYNGVLHAPTTGWSVAAITNVPEPGTLLLLILGVAGVIGTRLVKRREPAASLTAA